MLESARRFLRFLLVGVAVILVVVILAGLLVMESRVAPSVLPAAPIRWQLQTQSPDNNPEYESVKWLCSQVEIASRGQFIITPNPAGKIAKGTEIYDAVMNGKVEVGMGWPNWWFGRDDAWGIVQSGPFEFSSIEESMMYFYDGGGIELANQLCAKDGLIWRPAWWTGMEFGILTRSPVKSLADLSGKKIRIGPGIPQEVLRQASGAYAVATTPEEISSALKKGVIDGVEWTVPGATWEMKFHEQCPYVIVPAVWQPCVLGDFLINKSAYDSLPENLRTVLDVSIRAFALKATIKGKYLDIEAMEKYRAAGVSITKWSESDMVKWKDAAEKVYASHCASSPSFRKIYQSKMNFKKQYNRYMEMHGPYER